MRATFSLSVLREEPFLVRADPPLGLRHLVLGESWLRYAEERVVGLTLFEGSGLELDGELHLADTSVRVLVDGRHVEDRVALSERSTVRVALAPPHGGPPSGPLAHGGPVVVVGGVLGGDGRAGVGYENGLFEALIGSLFIESDFRSIREVLLLEVAAPGGLYVLPSLAAGIGVVLEQLGPRGEIAALRLRLSAQSWAVGFVADFDYVPSLGAWDVFLGARAGIGTQGVRASLAGYDIASFVA